MTRTRCRVHPVQRWGLEKRPRDGEPEPQRPRGRACVCIPVLCLTSSARFSASSPHFTGLCTWIIKSALRGRKRTNSKEPVTVQGACPEWCSLTSVLTFPPILSDAQLCSGQWACRKSDLQTTCLCCVLHLESLLDVSYSLSLSHNGFVGSV